MGDRSRGIQGRLVLPLSPAVDGDSRSARAWPVPRRFVMALLAVVALDQLTKSWAVRALDDKTIDLFWTLRLNLHFNSGLAFSQGKGLGGVQAVVACVVAGALAFIARRSPPWMALGLGIVAGGALGNAVDRVFRGDGFLDGAVVDFIDLQWWPIFNVADIALTVGGVVLLLLSARAEHAGVRNDEGAPTAADADG
jgi:signal peptidase II